MKTNIITTSFLIALTACISTSANASLVAGSTLLFGEQTFGCNWDIGTPPDDCTLDAYPDANYFEIDANNDGFVTSDRIAITAGTDGGLILNSIQGPGQIDETWTYFGNYGNHVTTSPITVASDDGNGFVTLDMSGLGIFWNDGYIPINVYDQIATVTCGNTCENGDTFVLDYINGICVGDCFDGPIYYQLHLTGTISSVPVPAAIWLFGSGIIALAGVAQRRKFTSSIDQA